MQSGNVSRFHVGAVILIISIIAGTCVLPRDAGAIPGPVTSGAPMVGPVVGQDDNNYTKLTPYAADPATLKPTFVTYCSWINAAVTAYAAANPTYQFSWARDLGPGQQPITAADFDVTNYTAWAGTSNNVTGGDGTVYNRNQTNQDAGGASLAFTYTPTGTDPKNVRFIQAYNESYTGGAYSIHLDRGRSATPFYDATGLSGTSANRRGQLAGNKSWFLDSAYDTEAKLLGIAGSAEGPNEIDTSSDVQFQVAVAVDNGPVAGTAIQHNVVLYAGLWWGYNYWNNDDVGRQAPDPDVDPINADNEPYQVFADDDPNGPAPFVPEPASVASTLLALIPLIVRRRGRA